VFVGLTYPGEIRVDHKWFKHRNRIRARNRISVVSRATREQRLV